MPRFVWSDFPLGNSCGRPHDPESQRVILGMGLDLLETASAGRTTVITPFRWSDDDSWKADFWRPEDDAAKLAATKAVFEQTKATQKGKIGTIGG